VKQWDIYTYDPGFGNHPAVILSHPDRVTNKPLVEILVCSSQRANRPANPMEVLLDSADGLNWETICKCDLILSVDKSDLHQHRGQVTVERQRQIISTIIRSHNWVL
jgi:mRNA-degrading endonuclease toxin of MazEF toxin-antitoxin module